MPDLRELVGAERCLDRMNSVLEACSVLHADDGDDVVFLGCDAGDGRLQRERAGRCDSDQRL
jgi:hypothetical protein